MEQLKLALEQYHVDGNYEISIDRLRDVLTENIPKEKPKRPQSAFFIWKSTNKEHINSQVTEKGRGKIASKAAEIWNTLSDDDKQPFIEEANTLRVDYHNKMNEYREEVVVTKSSSKRAGRPKLSEEEKTKRKVERDKVKATPSTREPDVDDTSSDDEINVDDFTYDGVDYLIDINSGDLYNPNTEEIVGKKDGENVTIY
jgi:hypothetical protein